MYIIYQEQPDIFDDFQSFNNKMLKKNFTKNEEKAGFTCLFTPIFTAALPNQN